MKIVRNRDGSYSAAQRHNGRLAIAEGATMADAGRRCLGLVIGMQDLERIQRRWAAATQQNGSHNEHE